MNKERLMNVLLAAARDGEGRDRHARKHNQYVFRVRGDATKTDVKQAVELMFEVKVEGVQVAQRAGQDAPLQEHRRQRSGWKKAYVSLDAGQSIDFTGAAKAKDSRSWHSSK